MGWPPMPKRIHYALNALCCLAQGKKRYRARDLARCAQMPPSEAAKILYLLSWGGFVSSCRGSKGGYWLARPPDEIRLRDVIRFLSPPEEKGEDARHDPVIGVWEETAGRGHETFERLTLAGLIREGHADLVLRCAPNELTTLNLAPSRSPEPYGTGRNDLAAPLGNVRR